MRKTKIMTQATLAVSAGLLLTACSSTHHESASYSTGQEGGYAMADDTAFNESAGAQTGSEWQAGSTSQSSQSYSSSGAMSGDQLVIPLHEERLNVGKRSVDAGTVTIRKIVTTETVSQPVELRKERVVIDRQGSGAQSGISSTSSSSQSSQRASSSSLNEPAGAERDQQLQQQQQQDQQDLNRKDQQNDQIQKNDLNQSSQPSESSSSSSTLNEPAGAQSSQSQQSSAGVSAGAGIGDSGVSASASAGASPSQDSSAAQTSSAADNSASASVSAQPSDVSAQATHSDQFSQQSRSTSQNVSSEPAGAQRQSASSSQSYSSSSTSPDSGALFQEQTYTIQLREEQPVVNKNVVETGRVVARKDAEMQHQTVQQQVRREDVQIDRGANAQNVQINGNVNASSSQYSEPAGAQYQQQNSSSFNSSYDSGAYRTESVAPTDEFRDSNTLDDINKGSNTRGGAEDLTDFDEKANSSRATIRDSAGAETRSQEINRSYESRGGARDLNNTPR